MLYKGSLLSGNIRHKVLRNARGRGKHFGRDVGVNVEREACFRVSEDAVDRGSEDPGGFYPKEPLPNHDQC